MTVSTSNLLRYNLRKLDEPVTLRDEIKHAEEYFAIQKKHDSGIGSSLDWILTKRA
ncbi:hypothetical protein GCM10020331_083620 [Ectobacillus funiculus]